MPHMQKTNADQQQRGLRMLSLDDGGVRGLSELFILREIMFRLMRLEKLSSLPKPCDYFDLIGGTGTGGVIALMLGRLRMPIDLAIEKYVAFSQKVYSDTKKWSLRSEKFKATVFESGMRAILQSAGFPEDVSMHDDNALCRSFVVALPSSNMTPRIFRTYQVDANQGDDCTVVQAARATTAAPDLFKPMAISSRGVTETFVGACLQYSNPVNLALEEAVTAFGLSQPVACLVNIGPGNSGHISWKPNNVFGQTMMELLHKIATNCEAQADAFAKQYIKTPGFFYRLSVLQGLQKIAVDDWNSQGEIKAHSLAYLQEAKTAEQVNNLANTLRSSPQKMTLQALRGNLSTNLSDKQRPSKLAQKLAQALSSSVSAPSPLFIGRKNILQHLEKCFDPLKPSVKMEVQLRCVLHGLGGAGKTQIALQFCHESKNRFSFMYMIDASSEASIVKSLTLLAEKAKLDETGPATALTWLRYQKEEWLLIFDNADDPKINLQSFFPDCKHGNILITSRNEAYKIYAPKNQYKIGEMSIEDSLAVFYEASQRSKNEETAANELVKELGYLVLAIVQAGSYLFNNQHMKVKQYLESYRKNMSRYMTKISNQTIDKYELSVFATWSLSYQKLDENARAMLMLCGVLHNSKIPVSILERAWKNLPQNHEIDTEELQDVFEKFVVNDNEWSDELVEEAVGMLRAYSLVEIRETEVLEIHSLVHGWAFQSLSKEQQKKAKQCGQQLFYCLGNGKFEYNDAAQWVLHAKALMKCLDYKFHDYKIAERLGRIFFIAQFWSEAEQLQQEVLIKMQSNSQPDTIKAMSSLAITLWKSGKLEEAEELQQEILSITSELNSSHPDTIQGMANLAAIFRQGGKYGEAEKLEQKVLKTRIETFGKAHSDTLQAMSNLASTFWKGGKLEEAESLEREVLQIRRKAFESIHHNTMLKTMINLAAILCKAGKLEEAEKLTQEVLEIRSQVLGSSHPDTLLAMSNLGGILSSRNKVQEAEKIEQEVLKIREEVFGSNHPSTIQAMSNLAATFSKGRNFLEAEKLGQKVLEIRIESFGSSHPYTIQAMSNLAAIVYESGNLQEAKRLQQKVLQIMTKAFGSSHPDTVQAMSNFSGILRQNEKLKEAENLEQEVLKFRKETFGKNHPDTIHAMSNLAATFRQGGNLLDAEKLEREVLKIRMESFEYNHPDTVQAMSYLAKTLSQSGKLQEAEKLQQEVLQNERKNFGSSHPTTIQAISNLAETFKKGGKLNEAKELQQEVLNLRKKAFGSKHPDTIVAMAHLAATLTLAGKLEEAENLEQEVLKVRKELLGSNHPDTIQAMANLALTFSAAGKLLETEKLEQEVLNVRILSFEKNHPDTIQAMSNLAATLYGRGKLQEAENLQQEVLQKSREAFGSSHPDTVFAMSNLSVILSKGGKWDETENLQQEVLQFRRKVFGDCYPDTLLAMSNLAGTFRSTGRLEEAEKLQQQVLKVRTEAFGSSHPDTLQAKTYLAVTFSQGGRLQEAERLQQEVLKVRLTDFGSSHPDTIQAMSNLSETLSKGRKWNEAEKLQQEVLNARMKIFGSSHPDTIQALFNLAEIFSKGGKLEEAEMLKQKVLKYREGGIGSSYSDST